jgi:peptidoglycan/xylan/chitin deacetylase (PgdA/CDA1 family)
VWAGVVSALLYEACMMQAKHATWAALFLAGCTTVTPDTTTSADAITQTSQLEGSDLPAGSYALTFDDGPGARTEELANWLGDRGIVATFFINGKNVPGLESAVSAVVARGHILANHTQNHEDMTTQSGDDLYRAVADTDAIISQYQPNGPWLLRAPFGSWSGRVSGEINGTSMSKYTGPIFWNVGGELTATTAADWACWGNDVTVGECGRLYMNEMRMRGRGVILMHDSHATSVDLAKLVVQQMEGTARFVPLTSAPRIASALGLQNPPSGPGDDPHPGEPKAGAPCGDVTYYGQCDHNVLSWCVDGVLTTADCTAKDDKVCSLIDLTQGHDCVARSACGDATYAGACDGNVLTWCDESGALRKQDCASRNRSCGFESNDTGYNCLP